MRLAYIAQGKLSLITPEQPARRIESRFAQDMIDRAIRRAESKAWRAGGGSGMWGNANLWNVKQDFDPAAVKIRFSDVTVGSADNEILYCLQSERVSGLFRYALDEDRELRLFHKNDFPLCDIHRHPERETVIAALEHQNGICNLIVFESDSPHYREVTTGDSRDEAPHWRRDKPEHIVYQSAGVGRNSHGHFAGLGPMAIIDLDTRTGALTPLVENDKADCLQPRTTGNGDLYYLRRPYQADPWRQHALWNSLKDFVLFPFRLLRAFIDYLNVFSMIYSRKPLKTAGGPQRPEEDISRTLLRGRVLNVQKALERYRSADDAPSLVPKNWELVQRRPDGSETVVAQGVSAFDVNADGGLCYTNGTGIFTRAPGSETERVGRDWLVEKVIAL